MRFLPYAQLLRLPNVFTAFADILLGTLATGMFRALPAQTVLLVAASGCLYCGGMVWNDIFDLEVDRRERPFRPLPSGRISKTTAVRIGYALLGLGVLFATAAGWRAGDYFWLPLEIAALLVAAILLYDGWLKHTPAGPVGMAACRFLNILLGLSLAAVAAFPWAHRFHLAAIVGLYIVGVTWFARAEAGRSNTNQLRGAAAMMLTALLLALAIPVQRPEGAVAWAFPYMLVAFGFFVGMPVAGAIGKPEASLVQAAVKRSILGLVVLDAVLATVFVGPYGLLLILLLPPAMLLARRVYST